MTKRVLLICLSLAGFALSACQPLQKPQEIAERTAPSSSLVTSSEAAESSPSSTSSSSALEAPQPSSEEAYDSILQTYHTRYHSQSHAFYDLNQDGLDELLIGDSQFVEAIYYLDNGRPMELVRSQVASGGGYRQAFNLFEDGAILMAEWTSGSGEGTAALYRILPGGLGHSVSGERQVQVPPGPDPALWGLAATPELDVTRIPWQENSRAVVQGVDFSAIAAGDYRSLAGSWRREDGQMIQFDDNGLVASGVDVTVMGEENGYLTLNVHAQGGGGYGIILVPAGVQLTGPYTQDLSNSSRDRLIAGQNMPPVLESSHFYYRLTD